MNNSKKAELTTSMCHIEKFSKSGISMHNFEVADTASKNNNNNNKNTCK